MMLLMALIGAVLYRVRGAGIWPSRPWWQMAFALPYAFTAAHGGFSGVVITITVFALTTGALLTGHASYIDLGSVKDGASNMPADGQSNEWYGVWIPGKGYWHDFAGLAVSGFLITLPSGLAVMMAGHLLIGAALAASGAVKPIGYAIAWLSIDRGITNHDPIAIGEFIAGGLMWGLMAIIVGGVS